MSETLKLHLRVLRKARLLKMIFPDKVRRIENMNNKDKPLFSLYQPLEILD